MSRLVLHIYLYIYKHYKTIDIFFYIIFCLLDSYLCGKLWDKMDTKYQNVKILCKDIRKTMERMGIPRHRYKLSLFIYKYINLATYYYIT